MDSMSTEQSWQRPEETRIACCAARFNTTRFDSCLETHKENNEKTEEEEGEEEDKEEDKEEEQKQQKEKRKKERT